MKPNIQGFYPEQLEQILSVRDAIHNPRKNGLATLRQCSLSGSPQPEPWLEVIRSQVGGFPVVVRSVRQHPLQGILRTEREFRQYFRGFYPEQLEQILSVRDAIHNPRKNGLATLRQCSLSGSPQPEPWLEVIRSQVGGFPVVVRSVRQHPLQGILRTEREFRQYFRRNSTVHHCGEYVVQEFIDDGYEFTALCTAKGGLIGGQDFLLDLSLRTRDNRNSHLACTASMETHRTILECIQNQLPYAVQLFTVEQTRDMLPGVESFAIQVIKATFSKSYSGAIFIKGFYKDHNDIFFLGFSLEPESETLRTLLAMSKTMPWEIALVESHYETNDNMQNGHSAPSPIHHCVVNFPTAEGVLIHQTSIPKR
ncbi:hypothetical protein NECAME_06166 [Necator americanus]|uniref:ATP-grasp domain-containing protein n=1 Tax=Necator americanus TaxID=51031 RepID=W2TY00_NECAM|nr:hypothetical protein NECAME_06166 [Necator americanus]ETN85921.1 hypothetical protein NECAME_06166 [Necator americanus]